MNPPSLCRATSHQYPLHSRAQAGIARRVRGDPILVSKISDSPASTRNMANPILGHWYRLYTRGTGPEKAIEPVVASLGIPYRWQHICLPYILDYFFPTLGLILEIDGASHDSPEAKEKDAARDAALAKKGWRTVRVSNEWALRATAEELRQVLGLDSP